MRTILLPPGVNPIAVKNKNIYIYLLIPQTKTVNNVQETNNSK
jgi:hypothetical protein